MAWAAIASLANAANEGISQQVGAGFRMIGGFQAEREARARGRVLRTLGRQATKDRRREGSRLIGAQRSAFAGGGVRISEGTPADLVADTAAREELEALRAGYGFRAESQALRQQGQLQRELGILGFFEPKGDIGGIVNASRQFGRPATPAQIGSPAVPALARGPVGAVGPTRILQRPTIVSGYS